MVGTCLPFSQPLHTSDTWTLWVPCPMTNGMGSSHLLTSEGPASALGPCLSAHLSEAPSLHLNAHQLPRLPTHNALVLSPKPDSQQWSVSTSSETDPSSRYLKRPPVAQRASQYLTTRCHLSRPSSQKSLSTPLPSTYTFMSMNKPCELYHPTTPRLQPFHILSTPRYPITSPWVVPPGMTT